MKTLLRPLAMLASIGNDSVSPTASRASAFQRTERVRYTNAQSPFSGDNRARLGYSAMHVAIQRRWQ